MFRAGRLWLVLLALTLAAPVARSNEPVEFHPTNKTANVVQVPSLKDALRYVNVATQTVVVGVEDAADTQAPSLTLSSPGEDAELTYVTLVRRARPNGDREEPISAR